MSDSPRLTRGQFCACEQIIEQFEQAWQSGSRPSLATFLLDVEVVDRLALLAELAAIDLEYRWHNGSAVLVEEYFHEYPELAAEEAIRHQLVLNECRVRRCHSLAPTPQELRDRFGDLLTMQGFSAEVIQESCGGISSLAEPSAVPGSSKPASDSVVGSTHVCLGHYRLIEQLGRGGFATVWRAWDTRLERHVALKIPHAELAADPEVIRRLWREIHLAARIRHDSIVPIHEVGQADGTLFVVYQLIEGKSLARVIQDQKPDFKQVACWMARVSEAVLVAHCAGIIHRDIKPANIMLDQSGAPVLTDFGLACLADRTDPMTREGDFLGTPAYMAPELAKGQAHLADARCDIYSLGAVMYELLCGNPPYFGRQIAIIQQVANRAPPPLRRFRPDIPRDLEIICLKAMAREPAHRYATAGDLASDLTNWLEKRPIAAKPQGPLVRSMLWCRRQPMLAATIFVALLICFSVAGVAFLRVIEERNRFELQRNEARNHLFKSLINEAEARIRARETGWAQQALSAIARAEQLQIESQDRFKLRSVALECLTSPYPSFQITDEWNSELQRLGRVAISPNGDWIAAAGEGQAILIWQTGNPKQSFQLPMYSTETICLAFSPDGSWLATGGVDESVQIWQVGCWISPQNCLPVHAWPLAAGAVQDLSWSANSQGLAACCQDGSVYWIGEITQDMPEPRLLTRHLSSARCVALTSNGEAVVSGGDDRSVRLTPIETPEAQRVWHVSDAVCSIAMTADGEQIIAVEPTSYGYNRISLVTGLVDSKPTMHRSPVTCVVTTPPQASWDLAHRRSLITASLDGTIRLWDGVDASLAVIAGALPGVQSMALTADSRRLVAGYVDGSIRMWERWDSPGVMASKFNAEVAVFGPNRIFDGNRIWHLDDSRNLSSRLLSPLPINLIALDDRGRRLAFVNQTEYEAEPQIQLWDTEARTLISKWSGGDKPLVALNFIPQRQQWMTLGSDGVMRLWNDAGESTEIIAVELENVDRLVTNTDGDIVVALAETGAQCWRIDGNEVEPIWKASWEPRQITTAVIAGENVVISSEQLELEIRSVVDGQLRGRLAGNRGPIVALAARLDGQQVAGAARDFSLHIW
ncbi:MAG TPA: serine/threonine-protein kinase, partial [Pirellulaceae bacterium]|nr:serine/threonine-protein kinase [Pirellulaceae bacterium]